MYHVVHLILSGKAAHENARLYPPVRPRLYRLDSRFGLLCISRSFRSRDYEPAYWISFFISPLLSAVLCIAILKLRHVPPTAWASGMLLLAIPGMIGEAVVLSHLSTFMPRIHASSGGRYGAFLFATYALVLGIAEVITLRATR